MRLVWNVVNKIDCLSMSPGTFNWETKLWQQNIKKNKKENISAGLTVEVLKSLKLVFSKYLNKIIPL